MILAINPGSTSVKYTAYEKDKKPYSGHFNKNTKGFEFNDQEITESDFEHSFQTFCNHLIEQKKIQKPDEIQKIGIRVVHGGTDFKSTTLLDDKALKKLEALSPLAPLHNPPALLIIQQIKSFLSNAQIYGVFDTAFHKDLPEHAWRYPILKPLCDEDSIRRYGFHGLAYQSVMSQLMKADPQATKKKVVACHLGGGSSIAAIVNGKSVDTTMGLTPLEGLMMMTRSGNIDPGVIEYLMREKGYSTQEVFSCLNKTSGIKGVTGFDDMETVMSKAEEGDEVCRLAIEMFVYRIVKQIYAYYGVLQGIDILTFSGGIGQGSAKLRSLIGAECRLIGIRIDEKKNTNTEGDFTSLTNPSANHQAYTVVVDEQAVIHEELTKASKR